MKKLIAIAAIAAAAVAAIRATDFPPQTANNTLNYTLMSSGVLETNKTGTGVFIEAANYHTIQFVNTGTNSAACMVDRSLDNTNWILVSTNAVAASATAEVTMVGRWSYIRARLRSTNTTVTATYLGGR